MNHVHAIFYYLLFFYTLSCCPMDGLSERYNHGALIYGKDSEQAAFFDALDYDVKLFTLRNLILNALEYFPSKIQVVKTMRSEQCPALLLKKQVPPDVEKIIKLAMPTTQMTQHPRHPHVFFCVHKDNDLVYMWANDRETLSNYFSERESDKPSYAHAIIMSLLLKQHAQSGTACVERAIGAVNAALATPDKPVVTDMAEFAARQATLPPIIMTTINRALNVRAYKTEKLCLDPPSRGSTPGSTSSPELAHASPLERHCTLL